MTTVQHRTPPLSTARVLGHDVDVFVSEPLVAGEYDAAHSPEVYRNFLDWMYATFRTDESRFRSAMVARLRLAPGDRVLITGCGLGDDVTPIVDAFGTQVEVVASDLSERMVAGAVATLDAAGVLARGAVRFAVADACALPFVDGSFDAVYHFGGINLFDDPALGIAEMTRVVRDGGRVVFGDEGIGPWLRGTDFARMVIANNRLWEADSLIAHLPITAVDVSLSWVLGGCFYVIEYAKRLAGPDVDPDVPHVGYRGGTMRTRHEGRIEGISPALRERLYAHAKATGTSVHALLEVAVSRTLEQ